MTLYQKPEFGYCPKNSLTHYDEALITANISSCSIKLLEAVTTTIEHLDTNLPGRQLILAEYMSQGQGTFSKHWHTYYRRQILMSYGPCFIEHKQRVQLSTQQCYVKILKILTELNEHCQFQHPNDYYVKGKKIAGILWTYVQGKIYCHLGLNVIPVTSNEYGSLLETVPQDRYMREKLVVKLIKALA